MVTPANIARSQYNDLIASGTMPPLLDYFDKRFFDLTNSREPAITSQELIDIAHQDKSARHIEHTFPPAIEQGGWAVGQYKELARLDIPLRHVGILRRIDTLVIDATTGKAITDWGNPHSWDPVFSYLLVLRRLQRREAAADRDRDSGTINNIIYPYRSIMGEPYYPLAQWSDQRYAWGNPANNIFMIIPDDVQLRLYGFASSDTELSHKIQGRLTATIQSSDNIAAAWAARRTANV